jgi:anti-anti-sigma factor
MDGNQPFEIGVVRREGDLVVSPSGEIDMATAPEVRRLVDERDPGVTRIVLDLRGVTFMDTSGLQLLIELDRGMQEAGVEFAAVPGPRSVQRLLDMAGLTGRLRLLESVDGAPDG